jgi:hypothetical protein
MINYFRTFLHAQTVQLSFQEDLVRQGFRHIQAFQLRPQTDCCLLRTMLNRTSSAKQRRMALSALASISSHSSSEMVTGFFDFPKSAFTTPCCTSRSCIFTFQISKLFFPLNFSISNLAL